MEGASLRRRKKKGIFLQQPHQARGKIADLRMKVVVWDKEVFGFDDYIGGKAKCVSLDILLSCQHMHV